MSLLTVDGRSEAVVKAAQSFEVNQITNPDQRQIGMSFARLAQEMILRIRRDDEGLIAALESLLEAREEAMVAIAPAPRKEQARAAAKAPARTTARRSTTKTTSSTR